MNGLLPKLLTSFWRDTMVNLRPFLRGRKARSWKITVVVATGTGHQEDQRIGGLKRIKGCVKVGGVGLPTVVQTSWG